METRFWSKVDKSGECWIWVGAKNGDYGEAWFSGRRCYAHRVSWELTHGSIPTGMCVLSRCGVTRCVRPDHLFLGAAADRIAKTKHAKGENHGMCKLTDDEVAVIRALRGVTGTGEIARSFGITPNTVLGIFKGRRS